MSISDLPAVNACLNGLSACFLFVGYIFIRRKNEQAHRNCMVAAFVTSTVFLASYLFYHWYRVRYQGIGVTKFPDLGWIRHLYLTILTTHTILAVVIVPLIFLSFYFALKRRIEAHRKVVKWAWPFWMYVSVTGVVIYFMLYQWFAPK